MTSPPFNNPHDSAYDAYSFAQADTPSHRGCYVYTPDNSDDYQCVAVWQPAPELGAREWTRFGQRVLIGVYRDEGRLGVIDPEERFVFRLLPSFKPVPIATVLEILAGADPLLSQELVNLTDIRTGSIVTETETKTLGAVQVARRHRQQLNELQKPLRQVYDARGEVIPPDLRFSKHENAKLYLTTPLINQHDPLPAANAFLPAYDFYGFPLNDLRSPFYSDAIIAYDEHEANGVSRFVNGGQPVYSGVIHDVFGDFVVGARSNNTLITRKPVQPLLVDQHNTPYKAPLRRG